MTVAVVARRRDRLKVLWENCGVQLLRIVLLLTLTTPDRHLRGVKVYRKR